MQSQDMDKHMRFLRIYAIENKILFRVSRSEISIEDISPESIALKKQSMEDLKNPKLQKREDVS